ncbi:MAG: beta galactosidase jelly roll domain-containing protein [Clostridia bacterium]|nr:beta galactosidase jelly roll domain-containing protein [Clostridia bacterium]
MEFRILSLNGNWDMDYVEEAYISDELPLFEGYEIKDAVPGYWEDMEDKFSIAPFASRFVINPEYTPLSYPISTTAPDTRLPNVIGNFFYKRTFDTDFAKDTVLHFGGVQNTVSVWINGVFLGRHEGYSSPFDMKIPDGLLKQKDNTIVMSVSNFQLKGYDGQFVSGLAARALTEGTGGITGNIELREYTSPIRDVAVFIGEDCKSATVKIESTEDCPISWQIIDGDDIILSGISNGDFEFSTEKMELWSPESPKLYTLRINCNGSTIDRRFGVRRLTVDGVKLKLNGRPYYLRGVCEHYSYPYTIHSDHDKDFYTKMVSSFKELGFNFARFHTCVPEEELMQVADEMGLLFQIECPGNTPFEQWPDIVRFCRQHPSVVIYCCGNELMLDAPFIEYLSAFADEVHENTDALFSPMSALRGIEYGREESQLHPGMVEKPFRHNPGRLDLIEKYSDLYSSYANGYLSYESLDADPEMLDSWSEVYKKPRLSHEICIDGTYADLSLIERYRGTRFEKTDMLTSIERHLKESGVLHKAQLYFENSSQWQRRVRKYCFEATRMCDTIVGYDFLGPIDTHWHTFGYDVEMMNEFYELKPGETAENVWRYNGETVLLTNLGKRANFICGEKLEFSVFASHYGAENLTGAILNVKLLTGDTVISEFDVPAEEIITGKVAKIEDICITLPHTDKAEQMTLCTTLSTNRKICENVWELYLFPEAKLCENDNLIISDGLTADELKKHLADGKDVVLFGTEPFKAMATTFRISLAGRTAGNLATVINRHPITDTIPHEGFCGWQFASLMEGGAAVCFKDAGIPFNPIIEVASTHKNVIRQAALFEFKVLNGRLIVCSFDLKDGDAAAKWLKSQITFYAASDKFNPADTISESQLDALINSDVEIIEGNKNFAFNANDKAATR